MQIRLAEVPMGVVEAPPPAGYMWIPSYNPNISPPLTVVGVLSMDCIRSSRNNSSRAWYLRVIGDGFGVPETGGAPQ